jgi:AMMECR1 domain-containing protein
LYRIPLKFVMLALVILLPLSSFPSGELLEEWILFSRSEQSESLISWLRCLMREELLGEACVGYRLPEHPPFYGRFGLFVTLKKKRQVRGCYGAFDHRSESIEAVLIEYLRGALRSDPRYAPVDVAEYDEIEIVVTVAGTPFPVRDLNVLDISRYGVIVTREDNSRIVIVPAEVRSTDYLKRKLPKRGIVQIAGFRAVTISARRHNRVSREKP